MFDALISECGTIAITTRLIQTGTTVKIRFSPSKTLRPGNYRWVHKNQTGEFVAFRKEEVERYGPRLDETNYILHIRNVTEKDEGRYRVQCWYRPKDKTVYTNSVDLKLQETGGIIRSTTVNSRTPTKGKAFTNNYK